MKKKIIYWLYNHFINLGRFKFIRKTIGGHWERWWLIGKPKDDLNFIFGDIWFDRHLNGTEGGYTVEGLPILRGLSKQEDYD